MMAQGANALGGRDDPLKKSAVARPETPCDVPHNPDLLQGASWGGAERSRPVDGQVLGGFAMLPAGKRGQPGCFLAQTVQAPFVFGSAPCGRLIGARWHGSIQQFSCACMRKCSCSNGHFAG